VRISREDLAKLQAGGTVEPRKPRAKAKDITAQYAGRKRRRCRECDRLFHEVVIAVQTLAKHRESHS
jgi:hypothetical protein